MQCGNNACVDIKDNGDGTFTYTSTLGADKGSTVYTAEEVSGHFAQVKAGRWNHIEEAAHEYIANDLFPEVTEDIAPDRTPV